MVIIRKVISYRIYKVFRTSKPHRITLLTIACCLVVGLGLGLGFGLDLVFGGQVVMHTYLYCFRLLLSYFRPF